MDTICRHYSIYIHICFSFKNFKLFFLVIKNSYQKLQIIEDVKSIFVLFFKQITNSVLAVNKPVFLKHVSAIFDQFFIFNQMIAPQKLRKMFFSSKKLFSFSRYSDFCILVFPSFSPCQPLLQRLIQHKSYSLCHHQPSK